MSELDMRRFSFYLSDNDDDLCCFEEPCLGDPIVSIHDLNLSEVVAIAIEHHVVCHSVPSLKEATG